MPRLRQLWQTVPVGQREIVGPERVAGERNQDLEAGSSIRCTVPFAWMTWNYRSALAASDPPTPWLTNGRFAGASCRRQPALCTLAGRTERSRTSGEYLAGLPTAPSSETTEPPEDPRRISQTAGARCSSRPGADRRGFDDSDEPDDRSRRFLPAGRFPTTARRAPDRPTDRSFATPRPGERVKASG